LHHHHYYYYPDNHHQHQKFYTFFIRNVHTKSWMITIMKKN
jgi:hypothetical protein